jgi:hypothetical protein
MILLKMGKSHTFTNGRKLNLAPTSIFFSPIWVKFGTGSEHYGSSSDGEFSENRRSEIRASLRSLNEILPALSKFVVRIGWNMVWDLCTRCCWAFASFMKIGAGNAVHVLWAQTKYHFCVYRKIVWRLESKERLGEVSTTLPTTQ